MKSCLIFLSVFVVLVLASRRAEAAYDKINEYLIQKVDDQDVSSNMEAAIKWLSEQETAKQSCFSRSPVPDLKKFTALQQVISDPKCDASDYEILQTNEAAVGLHQLNDARNVHRRVDKVMIQIFRDHAQKCQLVYLENYKAKKDQFDATAFRQVEKLARTVIQNIVKAQRWMMYTELEDPENLVHYIIRRSPKVNNYAGNEEIYHKALVDIASDSPNVKYTRRVSDERTGKSVVNKDKLKQLVSDYLIKPCQQFVATFGASLFIPAKFDSRAYFKVELKEKSYYLGWAYFKICEGIVEYEDAVYNDVIKSASNKY